MRVSASTTLIAAAMALVAVSAQAAPKETAPGQQMAANSADRYAVQAVCGTTKSGDEINLVTQT